MELGTGDQGLVRWGGAGIGRTLKDSRKSPRPIWHCCAPQQCPARAAHRAPSHAGVNGEGARVRAHSWAAAMVTDDAAWHGWTCVTSCYLFCFCLFVCLFSYPCPARINNTDRWCARARTRSTNNLNVCVVFTSSPPLLFFLLNEQQGRGNIYRTD